LQVSKNVFKKARIPVIPECRPLCQKDRPDGFLNDHQAAKTFLLGGGGDHPAQRDPAGAGKKLDRPGNACLTI
jgi:hypothetical protein